MKKINNACVTTSLVLLLFFTNHVAFAQYQPRIHITSIDQLPKAKSVRYKKQTKQVSRYKILGATNESIVVQEIVKVYAKAAYIFDFDNEVILHFFDKTGSHDFKYSKVIWKQTRQHQADDNVQSTVKLNNEDLVPNTYVLNNRIYAISANYYKRHSDNPKLKAAPVSIIQENDGKVTIKNKLLYAKVNDYAPCDIRVSADSSFFYMLSNKYLTKVQRRTNVTCARIFDDNLDEKELIPINVSGTTYITKTWLFVLSNGLKGPKGTPKRSKDDLYIYRYNIKDQSEATDHVNIAKFIQLNSWLSYKQLLNFDDDNASVLLGLTCVECRPETKKLRLGTVYIDFNRESNFVSFTENEVIPVKEDLDNDQSEFQQAFYKSLSERDLTEKKISVRTLTPVQYNAGLTTLTVKYIQSGYMISTPLLLNHDTEDGMETLALNRAMNSYGYTRHLPLVIEITDKEALLLSNFSVPKVDDDKIDMSANSSQVLEFSIVDLNTNTVYRENVSGELELSIKNDLHQISPGQPLQLGKQIFCITKTPDDAYYLSKITW